MIATGARRVLITGASSGIGRKIFASEDALKNLEFNRFFFSGLSLAEQLCKEGHQVTITVRDEEKAISTRQTLSERQVTGLLIDLVDAAQLLAESQPLHLRRRSRHAFHTLQEEQSFPRISRSRSTSSRWTSRSGHL